MLLFGLTEDLSPIETRALVLGFGARDLALTAGALPFASDRAHVAEAGTCVERGRQCRQNQNADNSSHTNDREARGKRAGQPPVELAEGFAEPFLILS